MSYLPLLFIIIGFGMLGIGLIAEGLCVLSGAGILYMCNVALDYYSEVGK